MKKLKRIATTLVLMLMWFQSFSQTDTSFWFAAPDVSILHGDRPVVFRFSSFKDAAHVKISLPGLSSIVQEIDLPANSERSYTINTPDFLEVKAGNIQNNGIHIQSSSKITAYYEVVGRGNNTDIYALKGRFALGLDFVAPMQNLYPNRADLNAYSSITVVATEDNTEIKFIPSKEVILHFGEDTIKMTLNKGQTYNFRALNEDIDSKLAGSRLISSKPVAISITDDSVLDGNNWDLIGDQLIPFKYAGKKYVLPEGYIAISSKNAMNFTTSTSTIDLSASNNFSQTFYNSTPQLVDFPDTVVVNYIDYYGSTAGAELGGAILPPLTCSGSREVSFVRSSERPFYIHLVFRTSSLDDFLLNGKTFKPDTNGIFKLDTNLSYLKIDLDENLVPTDQANRLLNTSAPFHLAIANGSGSTGYQLGYFSNFRNELLDTLYACEKYTSFDAYRANLDLYGQITVDTIDASHVDSVFVKFQVTDEYCITDDSAWVIQSKAPEVPIADSLFICNNIDSVITFDEYKVVFDDFFVQKSWELKKDSVKVYLENKAGCYNSKTAKIVYLDSLESVFPKDTAFCSGDTIEVKIGGNFDSLMINNKLVLIDSFFIQRDTILEISVSNVCGMQSKTVGLKELPLPVVDLGEDREICSKLFVLSLPQKYFYTWQDNSMDTSYLVDKTGEYSVLVEDSNKCQFSDTVVINLKQFDSIPVIPNSKICPDEPLQVRLAKGHDSYVWGDATVGPDRDLLEGIYSVQIDTKSNDTVCYTQSFSFEVSEWNLGLYNVITPNGDTKNETYVIEGLDDNYPLKFEVYNRWGALIFKDEDYKNTWGNQSLSDGVYYYQTSVGDFDCVKNKGFIMVIK